MESLGKAFRVLLVLALPALLPPPAKAQSAGGMPDLFELDLEELAFLTVTTASRKPEPLVDAPAKVTVITRQQMVERGYLNLFDLLRDLPGVDTHSYSHETTSNRIAIRGVEGNSRFIIQQNGVPIGSPAGDPIAVADNFPLYNALRVEVVYGPVSALYGADAFTGIINIVTEGGRENEAAVGSFLGEDGYRYLYGQGNYRLAEGLRLSLAGHLHHADNPDLSGSYRDTFALNDLVTFGGQVAVPAAERAGYYGATDSHTLDLGLQLGETVRAGFHQSEFSSPTTTGMLPDYIDYGKRGTWTSTVSTLHANYDDELTPTFGLHVLGLYSFYQVDPDSKFNNIFSNFEDGYKYAEADRSQFDLQVTWTPDERNHLVLGAVAEHFTAIPKTTDLIVPYDPDRGAGEQPLYYVGSDDTLRARIFETSYDNFGGYFQYRRSWHPQFDTVAGARYDGSSRYGSTFNPRLGLIYKPTGQLTAKLLYGEAFLAPAPEFTYEHFGAFSGDTDSEGRYTSGFMFIPNPDLEPEKIRTTEATFSWLPSPRFSAALSLYHSRVDNLIMNTGTPEPVADFIDGGVIASTSHNDNLGDLELFGGDLELSCLAAFGSSTLKTWGNYSYIDGSLEDSVRRKKVDLPFVSPHKLKLGLTYRYRGRYYLTPLVYWIDDSSTDVDALVGGGASTTSAGSYWLVGLRAGVEDIIPGLSFSLRVDNLFDQRYANAGTGVSITFAESPQNPRTVLCGLRYAF